MSLSVVSRIHEFVSRNVRLHKERTGWQYASVPMNVTKKEHQVTASKTQTVILIGLLIDAMRLMVMQTDDLTVASATT